MGNMAVITTDSIDLKASNNFGVYLHWDGGRDKVEAFLAYCKLKGYPPPERQPDYGWARLCLVIGNYIGGEDSLVIDLCNHMELDNGDNGVYIIRDWEIIGREYNRNPEQMDNNMFTMLCAINEAQPVKEQLDNSVFQELIGAIQEPPELIEGKIFEGIKTTKGLDARFRDLTRFLEMDKLTFEEYMQISREYKNAKEKLCEERQAR